MKLNEALECSQGRKLTASDLSTYQQWTLSYFHDEEHVADPSLSMTLQFDVSDARAVYEESFQARPGA